ncbi:MAG: restriction endonuclease subunit S [Actinomycetes bacterium]
MRVAPLWSVVEPAGIKVSPSAIPGTPEIVEHYAIDELGVTGQPRRQVPSEIASDKFLVRIDDLLVSRLNPRKGHVFEVAAHDVPSIASTEFAVVRPLGSVDRRFIKYVLTSERTRRLLDSQVRSATKSHGRVEFDAIWSLPVPVPPLETQRRIADYLDTETARIDTLITKNTHAAALVEERYAAGVESVVAGARRRHGDVALQYATERIMTGLDFAAADLSMDELVGHVRYVRTTDISDPDTLKPEGVYANREWIGRDSMAMEHDLLLTRAGSIGTAYRHRGTPVAFAGYLVGVRPGRASSDWLRVFVESQNYWDQVAVGAVRSTIDNFSGGKYAAMRVPVPPADEQARLSSEVADSRQGMRRAVAALRRQQALLLERRQALITAAVTGEIEV